MFFYDYNIARSIVNQRVDEALRNAEKRQLILSIQGSQPRIRQRLVIPDLKSLVTVYISQAAHAKQREGCNGELTNCPAG